MKSYNLPTIHIIALQRGCWVNKLFINGNYTTLKFYNTQEEAITDASCYKIPFKIHALYNAKHHTRGQFIS